jgi:hypothetical protein
VIVYVSIDIYIYTYGVLTACSTPNSGFEIYSFDWIQVSTQDWNLLSNFLDPIEGGTCIVSDKASILSRKLSTLKESTSKVSWNVHRPWSEANCRWFPGVWWGLCDLQFALIFVFWTETKSLAKWSSISNCVRLSMCKHIYITLHCITLHCIALHSTTLHSITLCYVISPLHYTTLHYLTFTLHYITLSHLYITLHSLISPWHNIISPLHYITFSYLTLTLHYITLHYIALLYLTLTSHDITLHVTLRYITLRYLTLTVYT